LTFGILLDEEVKDFALCRWRATSSSRASGSRCKDVLAKRGVIRSGALRKPSAADVAAIEVLLA